MVIGERVKKKPRAADRPQFRREMRALMEKLKPEIGEVSSNSMVLCAHADDFEPADNVLWELEGNRSSVRKDVHCFKCGGAVAMSNHLYAGYQKLDKKPRVCCGRCFPSLTTLDEETK